MATWKTSTKYLASFHFGNDAILLNTNSTYFCQQHVFRYFIY